MQKLFFLSALFLFQTLASGTPNHIFISTGTTNLVVLKDQKIRIIQNSLILNQISVTHNQQTYTLQYSRPIIGAGNEIVGPVTLNFDSEGVPRWIVYEVIPTQSELVIISGLTPNSAVLADNALYRDRINFRKNRTPFNWDYYKTVNSQQTLVGGLTLPVPFIRPALLLNSDYAKDYPGPGTLVRADHNLNWTSTSWAVIVFEKIPYNPPGTQSATVQIQKSPDLTTWSDLTNISVQTNQPNTYLRFKVGE
jgi:hypothetical protein